MGKPRIWLAKYRNDKGLTQQEVADVSDIERPFYTQIETGTRNPSVDKAKNIARALGFDWTIFFEDESGEKPQAPKNKAV